MLSTISRIFSSMHPIVAIITAAIFLSILYYIKKYKSVPPGPIGLPYLGLLPFLKEENSHIQVERLTREYGDIFSFTVTGKLYISLGTVKLIREAHLTNSECFNRLNDFSLLSYFFEDGVAFVNGDLWRTLRKFFTQAFKEYGMIAVKDSLAGPVYDQIRKTVDDIHASNGQSVNTTELLLESCCTIMRRMLFGENGITQKELLDLNEAYRVVIKGMTSTKLLIGGTLARYLIIPLFPDCRNALLNHKVMLNITKNVVERHKLNFDENSVNDVIDNFLKERMERSRRNDPSAKYFTDTALVSSLVQFVGDGILSVAIFIGAFLSSLVKYPDEQKKIYQEIVDLIGTERLPTMEDKSNLPYTNAFIYEVMRQSEFFAFFPSLECTKETTIQGYRIPKGSISLINMWSAHHDPLVYENPKEFNPSRFITKPGKPRPELPVMFGIGKRSCAGEAFTMMQVFLFLTAIVQNFEVSVPDGPLSKASIFYEPENMNLVYKSRTKK